jgi:hypothetical protein
MLHTLFRYSLGAMLLPLITNFQLFPEITTNTPDAMAPGKTASPEQFVGRMLVKAVPTNLAKNLVAPCTGNSGPSLLAFQEVKKGLGFLFQRHPSAHFQTAVNRR